jgi:phosphatidylglycerol:prolipoprotein diacylglycerol transferase
MASFWRDSPVLAGDRIIAAQHSGRARPSAITIRPMRRTVIALLARWLGGAAGWLVPGYSAMLAIGAMLAAVVVVEAAGRVGYPRRRSIEVLIVAYVGGLVGASCVPLAQAIAHALADGRFVARSGLAAYGGLIGGTLAAMVALRRLKLPVLPFLDAGAPALGLGYFFTRLGCFLAGCDYGLPTASRLGVRFPQGSAAWIDHVERGLVARDARASLAVHPTQLYLAFLGLALYLVISRVPARRQGYEGARISLYFAAYAVGRFAIETLRGDASRGAIGALSTSQAIAVATLSLLGALWSARLFRVLRSRAAIS